MSDYAISVKNISKKFKLYHEKRDSIFEVATSFFQKKRHHEILQVLDDVSFNVKYKDTEFIWMIVLSAGFFLTPIFYQFDMMPTQVQNVLQFSPMVQIVTMAHHVVLYGTLPSINTILYAIGSISAITAIGYLIFRKYQAKIVEEI